ncbi:unnamed protein product [Porites lobata]|uniref:Uncharacterized protein n=1 Tax=Porites lobata TaxID=104759 RepID=A0ABN8PXP6_9CNID|nr:unnamed protein product [Porites lobata]
MYETNPENVYITILYGVNNTISLEDIKEKNFTVTILTRYNVTVLRDTDCTQVEKQINGTMIQMYEIHPYFISELIVLIIISVIILSKLSSRYHSMKTLTVVLVILVFAVLLLYDVRGVHGSDKCSATSESLKFKISKTMPIKPVKFCTPVIKSQTIRRSRTKLFTRVASGYLVMRYALNKAPVYREGFPVYEKYVSIPGERAVRISSERVSLLDANGNLCLGYSSVPRTLKRT